MCKDSKHRETHQIKPHLKWLKQWGDSADLSTALLTEGFSRKQAEWNWKDLLSDILSVGPLITAVFWLLVYCWANWCIWLVLLWLFRAPYICLTYRVYPSVERVGKRVKDRERPARLRFPTSRLSIVYLFNQKRFVYISNQAESALTTSYGQHMNT